MTPLVGVLADDLTGALASAALLREAGMRAVVQWRRGEPPARASALVADMRTRDYGADPAARAEAWAAHLRGLGCRRIELRIDSTLRGAPAAELAGALAGAGLKDPWVLAVPAFPSAGRTVVRGELRAPGVTPPINGLPIGPLLFGDRDAEVLDIETIERGADAVLAAMAGAGTTRFVADGTGEAHLRTLAEAADRLAQPGDRERGLLTVSPGAWLRYHRPPLPESYPLVVLSSATATNAEQLAALRGSRAAQVFDARAVLSGEAVVDWDSVRRDAAAVVVETISRPAAEASGLFTEAARAAARVVEDGARHDMVCGGIVVGGGATGSALMDALEVGELVADGEVAPLCPHATVAAGRWTGLPVITKGGLVGGPETLTRLVEAVTKEMT
ncbi:four-carbon acid sugar kinase family protein [Pseudonocardia acaciae]|uniref:four-carbon acid sugar kinase family protein n=1 Tax=Pseudonocardia acaciae TaxID=551276 RepID=UPI00048D3C83|nr:four-carbon acid sugar kinase family protein [Pseudonocardia acaciae]